MHSINLPKLILFLLHLHKIMEGLYFHYSLSVCVCVYMSKMWRCLRSLNASCFSIFSLKTDVPFSLLVFPFYLWEMYFMSVTQTVFYVFYSFFFFFFFFFGGGGVGLLHTLAVTAFFVGSSTCHVQVC